MSNTPRPTRCVEEVSERELLFPNPAEEEVEELLEVERGVDEEAIEDPLEEVVEALERLVEKVENGMTKTLPPTSKKIPRGITIWTNRSKKLLEANSGFDRILV